MLVAFGFWHARPTDEVSEIAVHTGHADVKGRAIA
jgi:hypothetical protein